ncbi:MAG: hypothetical protein ACRBM6_27010 [Geminicoccales bacterium]
MDLIEVHLAQYLRHAIVLFHKHRGRIPSARRGEVPRSGIHALLRLARLETLRNNAKEYEQKRYKSANLSAFLRIMAT